MKTRTVLAIVVLAMILSAAATVWIAKKCFGPDAGYWIERAKYDADVKVRDDQIAAALKEIAAKDQTIADRDASLVLRDAKIATLLGSSAASDQALATAKAETVRLKTNAAAAIAANPAVKALVDNLEFRLAESEKQIFTLKAAFEEEAAARADVDAKFVAAAYQRDVWKKQYEGEHQLRIAAEGLVGHLERDLNTGKVWKTVGKVATVGAFVWGGIEIYNAAKRK